MALLHMARRLRSMTAQTNCFRPVQTGLQMRGDNSVGPLIDLQLPLEALVLHRCQRQVVAGCTDWPRSASGLPKFCGRHSATRLTWSMVAADPLRSPNLALIERPRPPAAVIHALASTAINQIWKNPCCHSAH